MYQFIDWLLCACALSECLLPPYILTVAGGRLQVSKSNCQPDT